MHKHRGFPSRMPGTDFQLTIRRPNKKGPTALIERQRYADRKHIDCKVDEFFLNALIVHFNNLPFVRGNLDAGRISWLLGREVMPVGEDFNRSCYDSLLRVDFSKVMISFPHLLTDVSLN